MQQLYKKLGAEYIFIGKLNPPSKRSVDTLSFCVEGEIAENFEYSIKHTPCEDVINIGVCSVPEGISACFPKNVLMNQLGIEA